MKDPKENVKKRDVEFLKIKPEEFPSFLVETFKAFGKFKINPVPISGHLQLID